VFEGAERFGNRVWYDSGGVESVGPGCPHIFSIFGWDHDLH